MMTEPSVGKVNLRELFFRVSVWAKGSDAGLEIVEGVALLLLVSRGLVIRVVARLTENELAEDPHDLIANYLLDAATQLASQPMNGADGIDGTARPDPRLCIVPPMGINP